MLKFKPTKHALMALGSAVVFLLVVPGLSRAQGRGNGRGLGPNLDKKCAKFVNCHDARDGRWDGRGPAMNPGINQVGQIPIGNVYGVRRGRHSDRDTEIYSRSRSRRVGRQDDASIPRDRTWRHRRSASGTIETRDRRIHRRDRTLTD